MMAENEDEEEEVEGKLRFREMRKFRDVESGRRR